MKLAICNETFGDWPHDKAFALARECGYTGIEMAPFTLHVDARKVTAVQRRAIVAAAESNDVELIGLHWLLAKTSGFHVTSPDPAVRKATADYLADLVALCRDLGGSLLVFGSPQQRSIPEGVSTDDASRYAVEVFQRVLPALERREVTLCLEPLGPAETDFLNTAAETVRMIEEIGSPWCRLHLDVKAMTTESATVPEILRSHCRLLHHFHANDPNKLGPGFGDVDFVPILEALGQVDYRGWISVEVFDYSPGPERIARESADYLRACRDRLSAES